MHKNYIVLFTITFLFLSCQKVNDAFSNNEKSEILLAQYYTPVNFGKEMKLKETESVVHYTYDNLKSDVQFVKWIRKSEYFTLEDTNYHDMIIIDETPFTFDSIGYVAFGHKERYTGKDYSSSIGVVYICEFIVNKTRYLVCEVVNVYSMGTDQIPLYYIFNINDKPIFIASAELDMNMNEVRVGLIYKNQKLIIPKELEK